MAIWPPEVAETSLRPTTSSVSRKPSEIELWLLFNVNRVYKLFDIYLWFTVQNELKQSLSVYSGALVRTELINTSMSSACFDFGLGFCLNAQIFTLIQRPVIGHWPRNIVLGLNILASAKAMILPST